MSVALIVIGTSLGGLRALMTLLGGLPADFPLPIVIVQHRLAESSSPLQLFLQQYSMLPVREVEDKMALSPGHALLAPADYHVLVEPGTLALSTEGPILAARPSIDVLFTTAADVYGPHLLGIILTGASGDGASGLRAIKQHGGVTVVQDPETAECRVMPEAALAATEADWILPLEQIAPFLVQYCCA